MRELLIEVYVVSAQRTLELRISDGMRVHEAVRAIGEMAAEITGLYQPSPASGLCWRDTGEALSLGDTLDSASVCSGDVLMLV